MIAVTGFTAVCQALEQLGMPRVFAVQLHFLYRYIFVLTEEVARVSRARELRSFGGAGLGIRPYSSLTGNLLLRTWELAERLHMAMLARGFSGEFHALHATRFGGKELVFLLGWSGVFLALRLWNVSGVMGAFMTGALS